MSSASGASSVVACADSAANAKFVIVGVTASKARAGSAADVAGASVTTPAGEASELGHATVFDRSTCADAGNEKLEEEDGAAVLKSPDT